MQLLGALADLTYGGAPPMLKTLAAAAGLVPAKAHRYLVSFVRSGLVERDINNGRYRLGPLARHIGIASIRGLEVVRTTSPQLSNIGERLEHSVALCVWGARGASVVWVEDYSRPITINTRIGEVLPTLTSATGRVFAAFLPRDQTEEVIARERADARRDTTLPSKAEFEQCLDRVRAAGVGWTMGGLNPTVNALSAPIFDYRGRTVAALSALGPAELFDATPDGPLANMVKAAAGELSALMGHRESAA